MSPKRAANGCREYLDSDVSIVAEIRELHALGIPFSRAHAFIDCLGAGHEHGDDSVSSLAIYRDSILELDRMITDPDLPPRPVPADSTRARLVTTRRKP